MVSFKFLRWSAGVCLLGSLLLAQNPQPAPAKDIVRTVVGTGNITGRVGRQTAAITRLIAGDSSNRLLFGSVNSGQVIRVNADGTSLSILANTNGASLDQLIPTSATQLAASAYLTSPGQVIADGSNNLYISTPTQILRIDAGTGLIRRIAGTGVSGAYNATTTATDANLGFPVGLALNGNDLYVAEPQYSIVRRIDLTNGNISIAAGIPNDFGSSGDGGQATAARLNSPQALAVGGGYLFISDRGNSRIRRVLLSSGVISNVAGTGNANFSGDGGPAASAQLNFPSGIALDASNRLLIADQSNSRIRRVENATSGTPGNISTLVGNGTSSFSNDGALAGTGTSILQPQGVAVINGEIYYSEGAYIRKFANAGSAISTIAGVGEANFILPGVDGTGSTIGRPVSVARGISEDVFFATDNQIFRFRFDGFTVERVAGKFNGAAGDGVALDARLANVQSLSVAGNGDIYFIEAGTNLVRRITPAGQLESVFNASNAEALTVSDTNIYITTNAAVFVSSNLAVPTLLAGDAGFPFPQRGYNDATGSTARFRLGESGEQCIAVQPGTGAIFVADRGNNRIRRISTAGEVTTFAGNGNGTDSGDGGPALSAGINGPLAIAFDNSGALLVTTSSGRIRRISGGNITTVAGNGIYGFTGEFGTATNLALSNIFAITVNTRGFAFFADTDNNRVRMFGNDIQTPFGYFDAPANGATGQSGQISVTGWALDDTTVQRVEVRRKPTPQETGTAVVGADGLVYIGDALFVLDARPDIATAYSANPQRRRGGWGYPLLSFGLPSYTQNSTTFAPGNGTFQLAAKAYDHAGNEALMRAEGTPTSGADANFVSLTFNNLSRTQPFGTIDLPSVGGIAFGSDYNNEGWILTLGPNNIDVTQNQPCRNGGGLNRIDLFLDGVTVPLANNQTCRFGNARPDVQATFTGPGFNAYPAFGNLPNVGVRWTVDTTQITDGLHQIAWIVRDSNGDQDGVGSRFYTVANGTTAPAQPVSDAKIGPSLRDPFGIGRMELVNRVPTNEVSVIRGFDDFAASEPANRLLDGSWITTAQLGKKILVDLGQPVTGGFVLAGDERLPLPAGTTLDLKTGRFHWYVIPPFYGPFRLEFERANGAMQPIIVNLVIK